MKITFPAENVVLMGPAEREAPTFEPAPAEPAAGTAGIRRGDKLAVKATVLAEVWRSVELAAVPAGSDACPVFVPAVHHTGYHAAVVELAQGKNTLIARDRVSRGIIRKGFEDGNRANGISGRVYEDVPVSVASGEEKGMHILRKHPEVDAILCAQDLLAVGVLNAAHDAGRSIPEDIAVMGEDNSILCQATRPQLSSLDTIIPAVAIASARALMDTLSGRPVVHRMILDMELVERGTT